MVLNPPSLNLPESDPKASSLYRIGSLCCVLVWIDRLVLSRTVRAMDLLGCDVLVHYCIDVFLGFRDIGYE